MSDEAVDDEQQLRELEELTHEAFLRGDREALAQILADGFISTGSDGTISTKADYIADNTASLRFESIRTDDLHVRTYGDAAVTLGRVTMKGLAGDAPFDATYGYTATYVRLDGRWQVVAEHVTLLQER